MRKARTLIERERAREKDEITDSYDYWFGYIVGILTTLMAMIVLTVAMCL